MGVLLCVHVARKGVAETQVCVLNKTDGEQQEKWRRMAARALSPGKWERLLLACGLCLPHYRLMALYVLQQQHRSGAAAASMQCVPCYHHDQERVENNNPAHLMVPVCGHRHVLPCMGRSAQQVSCFPREIKTTRENPCGLSALQ